MANSRLSRDLIQSNSSDTGIRINKYLSDAGVCSRREADNLIAADKVLIDGNVASFGQKVLPGQHVVCDGKAIHVNNRLILLAFNKPVGIECTTSDKNSDNIISYIHYPSRIFPIGRLDKNSSGLILLTNTGDISDQILKGSNCHEKEYLVNVNKPLTMDFIKHMSSGIEIFPNDSKNGVITRPCKVVATGKLSFKITLTQGLNRQIRRMCDALGYHVTSLKRIRILNIRLGNLSEGHYRNVTEAEVRTLLKQLKTYEDSSDI